MRARRWSSALVSASVAALAAGAGCFLLPSNPRQQEWDPPGGPARAAAVAPREPCADRDPMRRAFFGDLHVHTGYSMDARTRDLTLTPDDAYRFATGQPIDLPPLDETGHGTRTVRIDRPLDFAAVTDHAEWLGEVSLCTTTGSPAYDTDSCAAFRGERSTWLAWILGFDGRRGRMVGLMSLSGRNEEVCGTDATACRAAALSVWQQTLAAAERWYDRTSACRFTTFPAYEYSASPDRSKVHRNVIFRNEVVPELPISWIDEPAAEGLWRKLHERCLDTDTGCDVLAIPHNPNLSNGRLFTVPYRDQPLDEQRERAALRAGLEPLVEMMQIKGESECKNGMWDVVGEADELCDFEKLRGLPTVPDGDCEDGTGKGALNDSGCESRLDFVRYALVEGLREQDRIGVNPYEFGLIGGTDTHNAAPGIVAEATYPGSRGAEGATAEQRLTAVPGVRVRNEAFRNPGGLAGVWAEENSRDALFEAMRRRETFATSGPRIRPRFFGGWSFPADLCERSGLVERGYADGVAMGGELPDRPGGASAPTFVVHALADPGTETSPGHLLQRLQIIKGWADDDGRFHQEVHDVAGTADGGAEVDLATCEPHGPGSSVLCGWWRDPDFDPDRRAVYYARVVENPSCRWSWHQCLTLPPEERPNGCSNPEIPRVIQERAWTSPIWYEGGDPA